MFQRNCSRTSAWLALVSTTVVVGFASTAFAQADMSEPAAAKPAQAQPVKPAADLPKAEDLFDKAIDAMGGKDGEFKALESIHVAVTLAHPMMPAPMKFTSTRDNKDRFVMVQSNPMGGADSTIGSNGETMWMNNPQMGGYSLVEGPTREMVEQQIDGQAIITRHDVLSEFKKEAKEMRTMGSEKFGDQDAWKVRVVDKDLNESNMFFSKETSLPLGMTATQESQMGSVDLTVRFLEWKEFGPLKLYTKMEIEQGPMGAATISFDTIEVNKVEDKAFELPEEVKKLVEAKKSAPAEDETPAPAGGSVPHDHDGDGKPDH